MHKSVKEILIEEAAIVARSKELAQQINEDYEGERIVFIALLSGSVPFLAELIKHITLDCEIDFMDVSSYQGASSTGEVRVLKDLNGSIQDENVVIVEDIVDTGNTITVVKGMLESRMPKTLKIITLLDKPDGRVVECDADYVGFAIPNKFVVGFGLDYDELYRNFPYIGVLKEEYYM